MGGWHGLGRFEKQEKHKPIWNMVRISRGREDKRLSMASKIRQTKPSCGVREPRAGVAIQLVYAKESWEVRLEKMVHSGSGKC